MNRKSQECRCSSDDEICPCMKECDQEVLARVAERSGEIPAPFEVLAQRPGAASAFAAYRDQVFEQGPLGPRERALVQLTAAVALRLPFCIPKLVKAARKAGIDQEGIVQATLIASIQSANSMLHTAHDGLCAKDA
jgi:alkylhydroperoxidase/carboxymuconolactone decarboxylase family protein YurZ